MGAGGMLCLHAEVNLILQLREAGIKGGEIGVSKSCCGVCWEVVMGLREGGEHWVVYDNHGSIYKTLATGIYHIDKTALLHMERSLVQIIKAYLLT
jgi:hypothetical protein